LWPQTVLPFSQIPADQAKITCILLPDNIESTISLEQQNSDRYKTILVKTRSKCTVDL